MIENIGSKRRLLPQCVMLACELVALLGFVGVSGANEHGGHDEHGSASKPIVPESSAFSTRGVELGEYRIRAYYAAEGQKSKVGFTLYAIVDKERFAESEEIFEHRKQKLRDQVIIAARLVPLAEFDDAELKSFRKRILLRIRRTMPELSIDDVYVSDFNLAVESI